MKEQILKIKEEAIKSLESVKDLKEFQEVYSKFLGRKAELNTLIKNLKNLELSERKEIGKLINQTKDFLIKAFENKRKELEKEEKEKIDLTEPENLPLLGVKHPVSLIIEEIVDIFRSLGFKIEEGKEIDTEFYNFTALNIPSEHPSRDVFDTFYLDLPLQNNYRWLLRSHTSPSQIHILKRKQLPARFISPGRVYRPENLDASHSFMFHQIEGFYVDKDVKFSHLKGVLNLFAKKLFGKNTETRFRPHYFPFTEPSVEMDVSCFFCNKKGCSVCKKTGFIEILGAGLIHPNVLKACGINPKKWSGFAFGLGIERIAMLKFKISDIRYFTDNDIRFLNSFV